MNVIDRVESLKEKLDQNIPLLQQLILKPFDKDAELVHLKKEVSKLEREISIKIQEKQVKKQTPGDENANEIKGAQVIKMDCKESKPEKVLLKQMPEKKRKSLRI